MSRHQSQHVNYKVEDVFKRWLGEDSQISKPFLVVSTFVDAWRLVPESKEGTVSLLDPFVHLPRNLRP